MKISDLLRESNVIHDLVATDKRSVITKLVSTLEAEVGKDLADDSLNAVMDRESIMSTGVGKGLAIPHGRVKGLERNHVAFAVLTEPIEYGSIDGKTVNMVFLLVGPETQSSLHIKMLSRISRLMNNDNFRASLLEATSPSKIIEAFHVEETQYI